MKFHLMFLAGILLSYPSTAQVNVKDSLYSAPLSQAELTTVRNHFPVPGAVPDEDQHLSVSVMNYPDLNQVLRYKKFELGIQLPPGILERINFFLLEEGLHADELNPFLEWNVDVEASFFHPETGTSRTVDGYYHREYIENETTHDWDDIGTDFPFRIRYAPPQNGKWIARVTIKINEQDTHFSEWFGFHVIESGDPGYVAVHPNKKNLVRGNRMIFPVGHNFIGSDENHLIQWGGGGTLGNNLNVNNNTTKAMNILEWDHYLDKIESYFRQGGRYIRTLQTPWASLIEFEKKGNYYDRLHYAWEQDKLLDLCEQYDALMMFNMLIHTPLVVSDGYRVFGWDWERWWIDEHNNYFYDSLEQRPVYCYNDNPKKTGGKMPHETLSDEEDLKYHEQRTRYYIARYGYSTKIYEFELLSEPFNVDADARTGKHPYILPDNHTAQDVEDQQVLFSAIEKYHGRLATFIKEKMGHTEHLIGVDYLFGWKPDSHDIRLDQSMHHKNIDIIGVNYYAYAANKYIITKSGPNNEFQLNENTRARSFKEFQSWADKPIIVSEFGDGDDASVCSDFTGNYIDAMSMGFTGVCGFQLWEGKDSEQAFVWPATIRAQHHMNGEDVISTLSNGNGNWIQGRQKATLKTGGKEAVEHQYYVSHDRNQSVGYVRNRSFNFLTKQVSRYASCRMQYMDHQPPSPTDVLQDIRWNEVKNRGKHKRLRVEGLKSNATYEVKWYSYKNGLPMEEYTECRKTSRTNLVLHYPPLTTSPSGEENPVVWYVIQQTECNSPVK